MHFPSNRQKRGINAAEKEEEGSKEGKHACQKKEREARGEEKREGEKELLPETFLLRELEPTTGRE